MKLQSPRITRADLTPPPLTRRRREAERRRQGESIRAFAEAVQDHTAKMTMSLAQVAEALSCFSRSGLMTPKMRKQLRRQGFPRHTIVTVRTPTGTECRRIRQGLGGWK